MANFEVCNDVLTDAWNGLFEYRSRVDDVTEEELAVDQRRNLNLDGAGNFSREVSRDHVRNEALHLLAIGDCVQRQKFD